MSIPSFTTPTFVLNFTDRNLDLTAAVSVYVTLSQGYKEVTKKNEELEVTEKSITVLLTQRECGLFEPGEIEIQANWITQDGMRVPSTIATVQIDKQLLKKVIQ